MNKHKIAILSDTAGDFLELEDVFYVPLYVLFDNKSFKSNELSMDEYQKAYDANIQITTSKPTTEDYLASFNKIFAMGYETILSISISKEISGSYQSSIEARDMMGDKKKSIHTIDSRTAATPLLSFVYTIKKMIDGNVLLEEILKRAKNHPQNYVGGFFTGDLKYLMNAGRIGKGKALVGAIFGFKPMLIGDGDEGILRVWAKPRTHKGVYQVMCEEYMNSKNPSKDVFMGVGFKNPQLREECVSYFKEKGVDVNFIFTKVTTVVYTNFGGDVLSIAFYREQI